MTDEELDAIEARAKAASEHVWRSSYGDIVRHTGDSAGLIAESALDVPALAAEVHRLRGILAAVQSVIDGATCADDCYTVRSDVRDAMEGWR